MKKNYEERISPYEEGKIFFREGIIFFEERKNTFGQNILRHAQNIRAKTFVIILAALACTTSCSEPDEPDFEVINVDYSGYIYVSSAYFTDSYYGNDATLGIHTRESTYIVTFSDPQWGEAEFLDVSIGEELSGTGTLTMTYRGKVGTYDAVLGGTLEIPTISLPDVMGGTIITFHKGTAPEDASKGNIK